MVDVVLRETTDSVPDNVKVHAVGSGNTLKEATRDLVKKVSHTFRVYDLKEIEEKTHKAIDKRNILEAQNFLHGLSVYGQHDDLFIYNREGQYVVSGQPQEFFPLFFGKHKGQWADGKQREFVVEVVNESNTDSQQSPQPQASNG